MRLAAAYGASIWSIDAIWIRKTPERGIAWSWLCTQWCSGIRRVAGAEPIAVTPPVSRTTCASLLMPLMAVCVGKKGASVQFPIETWVIWVPPAFPAGWNGRNAWPRRTSQVPLIWNLRAPAGAASAKVIRSVAAATPLHPRRKHPRMDLPSERPRELAPRRMFWLPTDRALSYRPPVKLAGPTDGRPRVSLTDAGGRRLGRPRTPRGGGRSAPMPCYAAVQPPFDSFGWKSPWKMAFVSLSFSNALMLKQKLAARASISLMKAVP